MKELVVTPLQFTDGYYEKQGTLILKRHYIRIRTLSDGNIVVKCPGPDQPEHGTKD